MMSSCSAIPDCKETEDPAYTGELGHSSRWMKCPGFRCTPKNGSARYRCATSYSSPPVTPIPIVSYHSAAPAKEGVARRQGNIGRHEPLNVVRGGSGQVTGRGGQEPAPRDVAAPVPQRRDHRVP